MSTLTSHSSPNWQSHMMEEMPKIEIKFKRPTKWGMLKRFIFWGLAFLSGTRPQLTADPTYLCRQCSKVFSVICSVLSKLQYFTSVSVRSSSSILAVTWKQSTVARKSKRMWGREGCWFGGEWFSLYMKTLHHLSLAEIKQQRIATWASNVTAS